MSWVDELNKLDTRFIGLFVIILGVLVIGVGVAASTVTPIPAIQDKALEVFLLGIGLITAGTAMVNGNKMAQTKTAQAEMRRDMADVKEALQNVTLCTKPDADCDFARKATVEGLSTLK